MILAIRTDQPDAELHLLQEGNVIDSEVWKAHRMLGETISNRIDTILLRQSQSLKNINGIVFYSGPGSFTGLRIGASVVNAIANSYSIPIAGVSGDDWLIRGVKLLAEGSGSAFIVPVYGSDPHITVQKR